MVPLGRQASEHADRWDLSEGGGGWVSALGSGEEERGGECWVRYGG